MALSLSSPVETTTTTTTNAGGFLPHRYRYSRSKVSFCLTPKPKLRLFAKTVSSRPFAVKAHANKVAVDGSTNAAPVPAAKSGIPAQEKQNEESLRESSSKQLASEESISQFMSQVADLVKLVDSRDIVELQLKQNGCEISIRKKEAIEQTQAPAPVITMQSLPPPPAASPPAAATPPALPAPAPAAAASTSAKSSLPPFKCPMAGTFYRCPAPGEPPFVKVGDKVQKGQILCIIEAMKLMNEIEADQSGTIVEIVAEDGKPVSVDTPLFVIQP